MAINYPGTLDTFTDPSGTQYLSSPDHAGMHTDVHSAIEAIESVLGTTTGTSIAKNLTVGKFAAPTAGGTLTTTTISSGTLSGVLLGTSTITGGTASATVLNNNTIGTPLITGGTINNATLGTPNITGGTITNAVISNQDGWQQAQGTLTYLATDGSTFTATVNADISTAVGKGDKFKLTQGSTKYFLVTAINTGTVTLFGGTTYTLGTAAITSPQYSHHRSPYGFPLNPDAWTVEVTDTTQRIQNSPAAGTWYNPGTMKIDVPIGLWNLEYEVMSSSVGTNETGQAYITLNTTTSAGTLTDALTSSFFVAASTGGAVTNYAPQYRSKVVEITTKDDYFLNIMNTAAVNSISFENDNAPMVLRARSMYL